MVLRAFIIISAFSIIGFGQDFSSLQWLNGVWRMTNKIDTVKEYWRTADENLMIGKDFLQQGKDTLTLEEIHLSRINGKIVYSVIRPDENDGKPVYFNLLPTASGDSCIFENKQHDFPQRICYKLTSKTTMLAWIEGMDNGEFKKFEFPFRKEE